MCFVRKDSIIDQLKQRPLEVFMEHTTVISPIEIEKQLQYCWSIASLTVQWPDGKPLAFVDTYGCPNVRV